MTVGGVGAQAYITGHQEAGEGLAQQTDRLHSRGVLGVSCRAPLILVAGKDEAVCLSHEAFNRHNGVLAKMEAEVETLRFLAQPKGR